MYNIKNLNTVNPNNSFNIELFKNQFLKSSFLVVSIFNYFKN